MRRLILFDIDGTLIDVAGAGRVAMERACQRVFGIDEVSERCSGVRFAGMTDPVILESLARAVGIADVEYASRRDEFRAVFVEEMQGEMARPDPRRRTLPGVASLLEQLEARDDVHLGLLTGNLEAGAWAKLEFFGLHRYFAGGGFASDHRDRREIARIAWLRLIELTGVGYPAERVVVVGDTEHDVDCARANGFSAVAVGSGWVSREALERAGPDELLDDLSDSSRVFAAFGLN